MNVQDLPIPKPCSEDWDAMDGDARRRFCASCQKHVTDISTFTRDDALAFLEANPRACVQYAVMGEAILFEPPKRDSSTFARPGVLLRRVLAAGALFGSAPAFASSSASSDGGIVAWLWSWVADDTTEVTVTTGPVTAPVSEPAAPPQSLIPELSQPVAPPPVQVEPLRHLRGEVEPVRVLKGRPAPRPRP
ncbi:MAG: hypothetical protein KC656_25635 [Myxococcales bacterium]|nr:hypothetical protein [Myxococcales bacterium]